MRTIITLALLLFFSMTFGTVIEITKTEQLYKALESDSRDIQILLKKGEYTLTPRQVTDTSLGNAARPDSSIIVSAGLHIKNKSVIIQGENVNDTIINTLSGYGIFIENCPNVIIKNLSVRNGVRDADPNATSSAIVVKHSSAEVYNCLITANQGDYSKTVAGIAGIVGREGSILKIHNNIISNNSWDGIALYRGASALIYDNKIHSGRGAGIGITWDANALVYRNVIYDYWKGIGSFGTSRVSAFNNLVRDLRGWGIIASGNSQMVCRYNEVVRIGNVGIAAWNDSSRIHISDNVIRQSGREAQWVAPLVGVWINALPGFYTIERNLFFQNPEADIAKGTKMLDSEGRSFTFESLLDMTSNGQNYSIVLADSLIKTNNLPPTHPAIVDKGDPLVLDANVTRSDLGISGGWYGKWNWKPEGVPYLYESYDYGKKKDSHK